VLAYKM